MPKMMTEKLPKNAKKCQIFSCKVCYFECSKFSNYEKHISTLKHKMMTRGDASPVLTDKPLSCKPFYECECGKKYKFRQGLHRHKITCGVLHMELEYYETSNPCPPCVEPLPALYNTTSTASEKQLAEQAAIISNLTNLVTTMVEELAKQSAQTDRRNTMIEKMCDKIGNNTINNNINNVNYNINLFLNDQCKDAMNLTDFVKNIHCQIQDLEYTGKDG